MTNLPDWSRERPAGWWDPTRRLVRAIRRYQASRTRLMRRRWVLSHRFWSIVCACEIPLNGQLGGGLIVMHGFGVVIHPRAVIGANCIIFQQVTIGMGGPIPGVPTLGAGVLVGAGAKILGGVVVGDGAKIGANAVVIADVPPGATAVGIPARIVDRRDAAAP